MKKDGVLLRSDGTVQTQQSDFQKVLNRPSDELLWPLPRFMKVGHGTADVCPTVYTFSSTGLGATAAEEVLQQAFHRYLKGTDEVAPLYFPHRLASDCSQGTGGLHVTVTDPEAKLVHGVDESYTLLVDEKGIATLSAATVWGALHGIETLSQLVRFSAFPEKYFMAQLPLEIKDHPRFPHRGVLVDTGRHFENVATLKGIINALAHAKMNVLHWHITEDQSFPFPSDVFPQLAERGQWSDDERYSPGDVKDIVRHAWIHGVRVIPEFDMPGHSSAWRNALPEIFSKGCPEGRGAFAPFNTKTYEVLGKVLHEWSEMYFKDTFVHIGGDEVPTRCWSNFEEQSMQQKLGVSNPFDYFLKKVADINHGLNKQTIVWDEGFLSSQPDPSKVVIQVWQSSDTMRAATDQGFRTIRSQGWYLDWLDQTFDKMYAVDPLEGISDPEKQKLVLGGEACMWGEHVDGSNIQSTIWPRAAAVAEVLWSSPKSRSESDVHTRIATFRCLLLRRNIQASPSLGKGRGSVPNTWALGEGMPGDHTDGSCYTLNEHASDNL